MSQGSTLDSSSEEATSAAKRPYHAPELRKVGSMADLTRATVTGPPSDSQYTTFS